MTNPFIETRDQAEATAAAGQGRNRDWWETKPMTYADWASSDRIPETDQDFQEIENYVLDHGPWLKSWFAKLRLDEKTCLDLGSGSGIFSSLLARRGAKVMSMDLTEAGVALTRKTTTFFSSPTNIVRGDAENSPFRSDSFDFIYSWGVLHHTSDMDRAVSEAGRVLRPGGRGMMMVYYKRSVVYYVHGLFWLVFRGKMFSGHNFESVQDFYTDGFYHRYLTKAELEQKLQAAGVEVSSFTVTQYKKKILPFVPSWLDEILKRNFGMCLVAEFDKPE